MIQKYTYIRKVPPVKMNNNKYNYIYHMKLNGEKRKAEEDLIQ